MEDELKKIIFFIPTKRHADMKIKLDLHNLNQTDFYRLIVLRFLEEDPRILDILDEWKLANNIKPKYVVEEHQKERERAEAVIKGFGLDDDDIENIFDIIQQENPDV
jgi:hypothetical protein